MERVKGVGLRNLGAWGEEREESCDGMPVCSFGMGPDRARC